MIAAGSGGRHGALPAARTPVLTLTAEPVGAVMAGPAIRALELSRAVAAQGIPVDLVSLAGVGPLPGDAVPGLRVLAADDVDLPGAAAAARCVLLQGDVLGLLPWLADVDVPVVVDAYDPFHLEQLEQARSLGEQRRRAVVRDCVRSLNRQLARADLVLAASDRQRDLWLGHLAALGRVNPVTYDESPDLSGLLRVVPFGLPATPPPAATDDPVRRAFPAIGPDATVVLWAGGVYDWFDPQTVISAIAEIARTGPEVHLVVLGGGHPVLDPRAAEPGDPADGSASELAAAEPAARELAAAEPAARELAAMHAAVLGVLDRTVHLVDSWVPYDERGRWLAAADIGVVASHPGVETEFSFRTRLLDHLWAGLPTVSTAGDVLGELITATGAGRTTPTGDVAAMAAAIRELAQPAAREPAVRAAHDLARQFRWSTTAAPLVDFCRDPARSPDLLEDEAGRDLLGLHRETPPSAVRRVRAAVAEGGWRLVGRRLAARLGGRGRPGRRGPG